MTDSRGFFARLRIRAGLLAADYVKAVYATGTFSNAPQNAIEYSARLGPVIVASWHGQNMILPPFWHQEHPLTILVSRHKDADVAAAAYTRAGLNVIRGSGSAPGKMRASKGGAGALRQMVRALKQGTSVGITADMPPGPARRAGRGIIMLAQMSGHAIMPLAVTTKYRFVFSNWCRYAFNLPFSPGSITVGQPIKVPRDADEALVEAKRQELETALNDLTLQADGLAGRKRHYDTGGPPPLLPVSYWLYKSATYLITSLAPWWLKRRTAQGKEEAGRTSERYGSASLERPHGKLIWFHAASVGEALSCLGLISRLVDMDKDLHILMTTATVSAAEVLSNRMPARTFHQFAPLDLPASVHRFLDHWHPDLAVFAESEIWPNAIVELHHRSIPAALVNGRLSRRSFKRWRWAPKFIRALLSRLSHISAQSAEAEQRLAALGARNTVYYGNMKADIPAADISLPDLDTLKQQIGLRPFWLAASTHEGEEDIILDCHAILARTFPKLLTIIVPRHRDRADDIKRPIKARNLEVSSRSLDEKIDENTDVYLGDTFGEMALFYQLSKVSFIGGSFVKVGGHNPLEAIDGNSAIVHGPHVANFRDIYQLLDKHNAAVRVSNAEELSQAVARLLNDEEATANMASNGTAQSATLKGASDKTKTALLALLSNKGQG